MQVGIITIDGMPIGTISFSPKVEETAVMSFEDLAAVPDLRVDPGGAGTAQRHRHGPGHFNERSHAGTEPAKHPNAGKIGAGDDPRNMEGYIRERAAAHGHDPSTAIEVAKSEGLRDFSGDRGTSFGAFQLHKGGGLGDEFQKETGLDPADPKNEKETIDWAMKNLGRTGWGPYHGANRVGINRWEGIGGGPAAGGARGEQGSRGPNYFQRLGHGAYEQSELKNVETPYGSVRAHPQAASDVREFFKELHEQGAPLEGLGSYNKRTKRFGSGWSSHAMGTAFDLNDAQFLSKPMQNWIAADPKRWSDIQNKYNMSQYMPVKDPGHIEWIGPRAKPVVAKPFDPKTQPL